MTGGTKNVFRKRKARYDEFGCNPLDKAICFLNNETQKYNKVISCPYNRALSCYQNLTNELVIAGNLKAIEMKKGDFI